MNEKIAKIFSQVVLAEKTVRIKLLGDSITHGEGGDGFEQDGPEIVPGWNRNLHGNCWANKFKEYMEVNYNCEVINNGCTGTEIQFILEHFDELVDEEDQIILCTIGTNNRHKYFKDGPRPTRQQHMEAFYDNIVSLHERLKTTGKEYIFMANIPASAENEQDGPDYWRIFHMNDVQDLYQKASFSCGFPLIRMYSLFLNECRQQDICVDDLLADGLHPNDRGHEVMFRLLLEEIGVEGSANDINK